MIAGSVIIFDEAHNVADASCEGRSYDMYAANIKGSEAELQKILHAPKISDSLKEIKKSCKEKIGIISKFFEDLYATIIHFIQKS
jgi:Rad3-related DNA helicase